MRRSVGLLREWGEKGHGRGKERGFGVRKACLYRRS
jgi:hypothetical protein